MDDGGYKCECFPSLASALFLSSPDGRPFFFCLSLAEVFQLHRYQNCVQRGENGQLTKQQGGYRQLTKQQGGYGQLTKQQCGYGQLTKQQCGYGQLTKQQGVYKQIYRVLFYVCEVYLKKLFFIISAHFQRIKTIGRID